MDLSWMAWTWHTGLFFGFIACRAHCHDGLGVCPAGWRAPQRRILGLDTTRGDRLFISLSGVGLYPSGLAGPDFGAPLWGATIIAVIFGLAVFRWV